MPTIGVKNIGKYIAACKERFNQHFVYTSDGEKFNCIAGELIPYVEMPIPTLERKAIYKGNNLDSRSNWMQ